jgi:hypothetical protein
MAYARVLIRLIPLVAALGIACADDGPTGGEAPTDVISDGDVTDVEDDTFHVDPLPQRECTSNTDCFILYPEIEACETLLCDSGKGKCIFGDVQDLSLCEDKDHCTKETICLSGECSGGKDVDCEDGNPCTTDSCDSEIGCSFEPTPAPCEDGDPCTSGDGCQDGSCTSGFNICPCLSDADCAQFDDGDGCNGTLKCNDESLCVVDVSSVVICSGLDDDGCLKSECEPTLGECVTSLLPDGAPCQDDDVCTLSEKCQTGTCGSETALDCEGGTCSLGVCDPALGCQFEALEGPCDDGNACTEEDVCANGECVGTGNDCPCETLSDCAESDDGDLCNGTLDCIEGFCSVSENSAIACDPSENTGCQLAICIPATGECVNTPVNVAQPCDDGDACTLDSVCSDGICQGGAPIECQDENPCTNDLCDPVAGCVHDASEGICDDGDPCTVADSCKEGVCVGFELSGECVFECTTDEECDDGNLCTIDTCSSEFGTCSNAPDLNCMNCAVDGDCDDDNPCTLLICGENNQCTGGPVEAPCSDGTVCTQGDACVEGACLPGTEVSCDDGNPCTTDDCSPTTGCVFNAIPGCDECGAESLEGSCDDGNPCTLDGCNDGICTHLVTFDACEDGDLCTSGDLCIAGICTPGAPLNCEDGNACTANDCESGTGCVSAALDGAECDPGNPCASGGLCVEDLCAPLGGDDACCIIDAHCDDGFACSADACNAGSCANSPMQCTAETSCAIAYCSNGVCAQTPPSTSTVGHPIYTEHFDDGFAQGWTFESSNPNVEWSLTTASAFSGAWSLYLGNPETQSYDFGATEATAKSAPIALPDTAITLRFRRKMAVEEDHCFGDVLYVVIEKIGDDITVITPFMCESTSGLFALEQYDLSAFKGLHIRVWFGFATYDDQENQAAGIHLDNIDLIAFPGEGCCGLDADCNDGDPCTNDACDPILGCTHLVCGPEIPCQDPACSSGCDVENDPSCCATDTDCDDAYACTTDTCVGGGCQHSPIECPATNDPLCAVDFCFQGNCALSGPGALTDGQIIFYEDFDDGTTNGWSFSTNNDDVTWSTSTKQTSSPPLALYAGNPAAQSYDFGTSESIAKTPYISLPNAAITLRFDHWAEVEEDHCNADLLYVVVVSTTPGVPTQVLDPKQCESTDGQFITREYSLDAFAGANVAVWFGFATFDVLENNGEGMYIDEIRLLATPSGPCD